MHDPDVVAFDIRRPWPKRSRTYDAKPGQPRWKVGHAFWTVAGRGLYWPTLITVWHREPGGKDSGEICKHYVRWRGDDGKWQSKILHGWRFHIHHWRIQVHPLQTLRRWALTRCSWCGGQSRKGDHVNISHQWDGPRGPWWRGEPGLFHRDCSSIERAHRTCLCADPLLTHGSYGRCAMCGKGSSFGRTELQIAQARVLAAVPAGQRDADAYQRVCDMYAASKKIKESA
ncbi:hypothetical protein [Dactylosporangium sp. CA-139066]|uniref:hypothetical protein n=1 Tax=Dactylosporangium sp. CA-139066 TaxID=3239930 RepID=UPI003D944859